MLIFGAHMSIADGFGAAARKAVEEYGANAMQIFTKNPRGRAVKSMVGGDLALYRDFKPRLKFVVAHSSYLLNFGRPMAEIPWAENDLLTDFERMEVLEGDGIVVHVGKAMGGDEQKAFQNITENAKKIIEKTSKTGIGYFLENTAGQGSELGYTLEHLSKINNEMAPAGRRFKFCLDTAHLWAAGFNLSTAQSSRKVLTEIESAIGVDKIACFHFNDSKKELGTRVDRHDNLGKGQIPLEGLSVILHYAVEKTIPVILETPDKTPADRQNDLAVLRHLTESN